MDQIEWLEKWYQQACNGYWENFYGIEIGTLDNPGWYISVDLKETQYENLKMKEILWEKGKDDWMRCEISNGIFRGVGDSLKLRQIVQIFRNVVESK